MHSMRINVLPTLIKPISTSKHVYSYFEMDNRPVCRIRMAHLSHKMCTQTPIKLLLLMDHLDHSGVLPPNLKHTTLKVHHRNSMLDVRNGSGLRIFTADKLNLRLDL